MKRSLLLGRGGRILNVISWMQAIKLMYFRDNGNAVFPLAYHDYEVKSKSESFPLPSVLMLANKRDKYSGYDKLPLTRQNILIRDQYTCQWCGKKLSQSSCTIDHVFPTSRGGTNTWRNVVASCSACNSEKGKMLPEQYEKKSGKKLLNKPITPSRGILFKEYLRKEGYAEWEPYLS